MEKNVPNWDLAFGGFFFFFLDVPSLITRNQGSLVGHRVRIMCGSDEK